MFQAEGITLICGDCLDVLPTISGVDAVITDPPYGMDWDTDSTRFSGGLRGRGDGRDDMPKISGDCDPFDPAPWIAFPRVVLFGANHFQQRLPVGTTLVWVKKGDHLWGTFLSDAEVGWMKSGHGVYLFRNEWCPPARAKDRGARTNHSVHPTQKPVSLMSWCMARAKCPSGSLVLDPYMGSGTTGIACIRTGRRFIGIEKSPEYFQIAVERIKRELSQPQLPSMQPTKTFVNGELFQAKK